MTGSYPKKAPEPRIEKKRKKDKEKEGKI